MSTYLLGIKSCRPMFRKFTLQQQFLWDCIFHEFCLSLLRESDINNKHTPGTSFSAHVGIKANPG